MSNLDIGAFKKTFATTYVVFLGNMFESFTTEVYGVRVLAYLPKLIVYGCTSNISKVNH